MATGATTGYAAGEQTNTSPIDYAQEITFNTPPGGTYQRLRMTGESLAAQDSTTALDEINDLPETAETILTARSTSGSINGALSYGTYDDFLAGIMGADWQNISMPANAPGMFTITKDDPSAHAQGHSTLWYRSSTGTGFSDWPQTGIICLKDPASGFVFYSTYKKSTDVLLFINEDMQSLPDGQTALSAQAVASLVGIMNESLGKTYTVRKKVAGEWQVFSGLMVSQVQIQLQKGQTPTIQIDFIGSDMTVTTVDASSAVNAVTTSPLMDVVSGFLGCSIFGTVPAGCIQSATITLTRDGAAQDTGMGHVGACGVQFGAFKVGMDIEYFFKDYTAFLAWQSGQKGIVSVGIQDCDGYGYRFFIFNGRIFNPKNPISSKNATIVTTISVTGNPLPDGGTFGIERITPSS